LGSSIFAGSLLGRRQERRVVSSWRRRLSLAHASFPLSHPRPVWILLEAKVEPYLARMGFLRKKWDHFLGGGDAPRSSPRGWLGFLGKAELPFLLNCWYLHFRCQLGCWSRNLKQTTWKS
jgi:hypothetical protein